MDEPNLEILLADALRPVDPPQSLASKLEGTLAAISEAAASELSGWADDFNEGELDALRDPRNWVRPMVAATAGGVATGALVLFELRRRGRQRSSGLRGLADEVRSRI